MNTSNCITVRADAGSIAFASWAHHEMAMDYLQIRITTAKELALTTAQKNEKHIYFYTYMNRKVENLNSN
jgi:hypothetical protein